jgi:pyroglutamyl-peptidase
MKVQFRPSAFVLLGLFLFAASASASQIVLTAFEPFGGDPVNNSAEVASRLAVLLRDAAPAGKIEVKLCILPVEYDRGARVALDCIGNARPDLVLSLGAGSCEIDFETRARNRDDTFAPDNAGVLRTENSPIIPGAPEYLALNAPMRDLYLKSPHRDSLGNLSEDAGAYVCNNTAYWLAHEFAGPDSPTRYGFIHVPPTTCAPEIRDPAMLADTIFQALRAAMPELF